MTAQVQNPTATQEVEVHVVDAENGIYYTPIDLSQVNIAITGARLYGDGTIELDTQFNDCSTTIAYFEGEIVCTGDPLI